MVILGFSKKCQFGAFCSVIHYIIRHNHRPMLPLNPRLTWKCFVFFSKIKCWLHSEHLSLSVCRFFFSLPWQWIRLLLYCYLKVYFSCPLSPKWVTPASCPWARKCVCVLLRVTFLCFFASLNLFFCFFFLLCLPLPLKWWLLKTGVFFLLFVVHFPYNLKKQPQDLKYMTIIFSSGCSFRNFCT